MTADDAFEWTPALCLIKRYVYERDSDVAEQLMSTDPVLVTTRPTEVELRRNPTRLLQGEDLLGARRRVGAGEPRCCYLQ